MDIQFEKAELVPIASVCSLLGMYSEVTPVKRTITHETGVQDVEYALILTSEQFRKLA